MANPLDVLSGSMNAGCQWDGSKTDTVYGTVRNNIGKQYSNPFNQGGTGGNETADQLAVIRRTITNGSPVTLDLSAVLKNIAQNAAATFGHLIGIQIALVTPIDDATNGLSASSITITLPMSNPLAWFFGSTDATVTLTLKGGATCRGDKLAFFSSTANKQALSGSTASIVLTNPDSSHTACVEITLIGTSA